MPWVRMAQSGGNAMNAIQVDTDRALLISYSATVHAPSVLSKPVLHESAQLELF
jgi:hypothetical protein